MAARFRLPAQGIEGYRLEGLDGQALGNVAAADRDGADLLVLVGGRLAAVGGDLRPLDWDEIVWIDPNRRSLLVTREGAAALLRTPPASAGPAARRRPGRRRTAAQVAGTVGVLSVVSALLEAGGAEGKTPAWALLAIAAVAFAAVFLLRRRGSHAPSTTLAGQKG